MENFRNSTEYDFSGEAVVGSITARNSFLMPRLLDTEEFYACVYPENRKKEITAFTDDQRKIIGSNEVFQANLYVTR